MGTVATEKATSSGRPAVEVYDKPKRTIVVSADARLLDVYRKEATVRQIEPPGPTFTLVTDEPKSVHGSETAPSPIQYFTSSIVFCMLSHLLWMASAKKVTINDMRMHATTRFGQEGSVLKGSVSAWPLDFDTCIEIDSPEPPERVAELVRLAEETCFVFRSLIQPVTVNRTFTLNGEPLEA